jgi:ABC-type phosphate transport system substrate-binding protein
MKLKIFMLLALLLFSTQSVPVDIIVNKDAQVDVLPIDEVSSIFTLTKSHWHNGLKIKVFVLPKDSVITKAFSYKVLRMPSAMYFDILEAKYASGKTNIPVVLDSEYSLLVKMSTTPGSIGYVYKADILIDTPNLKVLKIKE